MAPMNWVVGLYTVNRAFGGNEEGGWWYDTGELEKTLQVFRNEEDAIAYCRKFNQRLMRWVNKGRKRDIGSVCCSGAYQAQVHHLVLPLHFPVVRPHYE